jgi:hypothetical protein
VVPQKASSLRAMVGLTSQHVTSDSFQEVLLVHFATDQHIKLVALEAGQDTSVENVVLSPTLGQA